MDKAALFMLLLLSMISYGSTRSIKENLYPICDGMNQTTHQQTQVLELELGTTVTCEPVYSFLPCAGTVWGQLFMLVIYELLLALSQQYIQSGSNLFFQMFGTGIFGASLFHVLGVFPQVILVIVIASVEDSDTVQSMASMGMSMLAGSAIMHLTVSWGFVVAFGSYDHSDTSASANSDNKKLSSLSGYGVETDIETRYTSRIMLLSMIPFLILQLAKVINSATGMRIVVLISLVTTLILLFSYCIYQVFEPWIQNRRLDYILNKFVQKKLLKSFLVVNGQPNVRRIEDLFQKLDGNGDSYISKNELRAVILGMEIQEVGLHDEDFEKKVMEEFDVSGDDHISGTEFVNGLSKLLSKASNSVTKQKSDANGPKSSSRKDTKEENQSLLGHKKESKTAESDKPWWNHIKAAFLLILGTAITSVLGSPLLQTVQEFSTSANIPSFLVSYVVIPLALGYQQVLGTIKSAREKTENAVSLTFSEIYGAVFMNNIVGLATFLLLVYIRDLTWGVSAEVLVVLIICTVMGLLGSFITKIPFWTCIIVYLLYPISLLMLYVLIEVFGWS